MRYRGAGLAEILHHGNDHLSGLRGSPGGDSRPIGVKNGRVSAVVHDFGLRALGPLLRGGVETAVQKVEDVIVLFNFGWRGRRLHEPDAIDYEIVVAITHSH